MAKIKPVLGRGLASLIPRQASVPPLPVGGQDDGVSNEIIASIALDRIQQNPYQPRAEFEPVALDELKRSIQEKGIIQPITVRRLGESYQLISGERRVRAAREAGLKQIPAYIIRVRTNEEMLELALIENLQREHLNPIEIAISYKRLIDECRYTQEEVSQKIGKDRTTITNFLRLLKLPEPIQSAVRRGEISSGHARALIAIDDPERQMEIFRRAVGRGLSVRDVERLAREKGGKRGGRRREGGHAGGAVSSSLASIEERLRRFLGTRVQVRMLQDGKGEILIEYYSADDLERILEIFSEVEDRTR
ncbi:MAG TPA: ParB/RepB/Spo0J family partition protein [Bacteroidota bacterium]|nr:ParB/RepB/Spo0J family partition protein [Bacteroidota bacterium]